MVGSSISNTLSSSVTLGVGGYTIPLTITATGDVAPVLLGADAIVDPATLAHARIINHGIVAGAGGGSSDGGIGIDLAGSTAAVINSGMISGGSGNIGGIGVKFAAGGRLSNSGTIAGGAGQNYGTSAAAVWADGDTQIVNSGRITGGYSVPMTHHQYHYFARGAGIYLESTGSVVNTGYILGGGAAYSGNPFTAAVDLASGGRLSNAGGVIEGAVGGIGVAAANGATVVNTGKILGGSGAQKGANIYVGYSYNGACGVKLTNGGTLFNRGSIYGGEGGTDAFFPPFLGVGQSAPGVVLTSGGTVFNSGVIVGGQTTGDGAAETGLLSQSGGTVSNTGTISGGFGGGAGVDLQLGGELTNRGLIVGAGGYTGYFLSGTGGGTGVGLASGADAFNGGSISGGKGGQGLNGTFGEGFPTYYNNGGTGGTGVALGSGGTFTNSGSITAGAGGDGTGAGGAGGIGVSVSNAKFINRGAINGGAGGAGVNANSLGFKYFYSPGGTGGAGVVLGSGSTLTNAGTITAGAGGTGKASGGVGGIGVSVSNADLINHGVIAGGAGAMGGIDPGGAGGAGVYLNGGTLINTGEISGGLGFGGVTADAVQFGSASGELIIVPGAVFNGAVSANAAVQDVLALGGKTGGTLSGLGSQFTGFSIISEAVGADWSLTGSNVLGAATGLQVHGVLSVTGTLGDAGHAIVVGDGDLQASGIGAVQIASATMKGGTLACSTSATFVVGAGLVGAQAGAITLDSGATLAGFGAADAAQIVDNGHIAANGGTLVLDGAVSGTGALAIDSGGVLSVAGSLSVAHLVFRPGGNEVLLAGASAITSTLSGFGAGDVIDIAKLTATTLSFLGGTLTLLDGTAAVDSLTLTGSYTAANFSVMSDGQGGTDISFVPTGTGPALAGETLASAHPALTAASAHWWLDTGGQVSAWPIDVSRW